MHHKTKLKIIFCLAIFGIVVSSYLAYSHFKDEPAFCNISESLNCDVVNKSIYSVDPLFGIPVAAWGFLSYTVMAIMLGLTYHKPHLQLFGNSFLFIVAWISGAGLIYSLYLTYVEFFILRTLCPFCILSLITISLIFIFSSILSIKEEKRIIHENIEKTNLV